MIRLFLTKQFLGFLAVGGTAALLHWLSRIILSNWLSFALSVAVAYSIGMLVAFLLNRIFVFPKSKRPIGKQAISFIIVNLSFFPIVWIASILINKIAQLFLADNLSQAISHGIAVSIPAAVTFLIYKFFTFKDVENERIGII